MVSLTDWELAEIQIFVDRSLNQLEELGLILSVDDDMEAFAEFLAAQPQNHGVPTTHDPGLTHLLPSNAYWSKLTASDGRVVSCNGQRMRITSDLLADIRTHRLFFDRLPIISHYPLALYDDLDLPTMSGRVGMGGGMWVQPDFRGKGLYNIYSPLVRAIAMRHFGLDWYCAFYVNSPSRKSLGRVGAGFTHSAPLLKGMYPPHERVMDIQFMWMSDQEMMDYILEANDSADIGSRRKRHA